MIYSANAMLMAARRCRIHARRWGTHARRAIYPVLITIYPVLTSRLHGNMPDILAPRCCLQEIIARFLARRCRIQENTATTGVFIGYEDGINSFQRRQNSFLHLLNIFSLLCIGFCGGLILNCLRQLFAGLFIKAKKNHSANTRY